MVEFNIGFIEIYWDFVGICGEWEGFVVVVNQDRIWVFGEFVRFVLLFIFFLLWGKDFEKDKFLFLDFMLFEVLMFCGFGILVGINIFNYDDI